MAAQPWTYYKFYSNGREFVEASPTGAPMGAQVIPFEEFKSKAQNQYEKAWYGEGKSYWDFIKSQPQFAGMDTPDPADDKTGVVKQGDQYISQSALDTDAANKAGVANGTMAEIAPGVYVPTGSPAHQNFINPGSVQNQTLPGPTNPVKVGMSDGPVVPGVTPSSPTPVQPTQSPTAQPYSPAPNAPQASAPVAPPTVNPNTGAPLNNTPSGTNPPPSNAQSQMTDQQFEAWLNSQNLSADQKAAIRALYNAVGTNDQASADKIKAAIEAGTAYSDPYFKAQSKLVLDALDRGINAKEGDLAYNETTLANRLADLRKTIEDSSDYLTFQQQQELKDLERKYTADLENTQQDLANRGFTSSSIRTKKENLLSDVYGDFRESSNRAFQFKQTGLQDQLTQGTRDNAAELARLRDLTAQGKLDLLRKGEETLGTTAMQGAGYGDLLGGIGGELPRAQAQDAFSFAQNFAF